MNRWPGIVCLISLSHAALAQDDSANDATVSGRVVDQATQQPVLFVTVTVRNESDGVTVTGALTDDDGRFVISGLGRGNYILTSRFLGYLSVDTPIFIGDKNTIFDVGDIEFEQSSEELEEVIVSARQDILEASLDRRVFNLADNFAQTSGSLLDAMRGLPGVAVDQGGSFQKRRQ